MENALKKTRTPNLAGIRRTIQFPFQRFFRTEASSGILLILFSALALFWANSPWAQTYFRLWQTEFVIALGGFGISKSLLLWVNDGLMALFFLVVGLEIKREFLVGELSSRGKALLPVMAALGGMVVPAVIYMALNFGTPGAPGWGIPMATDIAFALGILSLVGRRAPLSLRIFLTAVAIVDDIGAVLVITLFYTDAVAWTSLAVAAFFLLVLITANRMDIRHPFVYALLGIGLWVAFLKSGVHATVSGILLAMTIPASTRIDGQLFLNRGRVFLGEFDRAGATGKNILTNREQRAAVKALEIACEQVQAPLQRMEYALHPWVAYVIVPIFALANAGVSLSGATISTLLQPITLGIILGLVVGKQVGIMLAVWIALRRRLAQMPSGVTWRQLYGVAWLAGIGFTMSLFVTALAFDDIQLIRAAKVGILIASIVAAAGGWLFLDFIVRQGAKHARNDEGRKDI